MLQEEQEWQVKVTFPLEERRMSKKERSKEQGGHESEVKAQIGASKEEGERKEEVVNSAHDCVRSDSDSTHDEVTKLAWWIRIASRTTLEDVARLSLSVASSHKSRAGSARHKKVLRGRLRAMAFLHAPIDNASNTLHIVSHLPPRSVRRHGWLWVLEKAFFGLRVAPQKFHDWLANLFVFPWIEAHGWTSCVFPARREGRRDCESHL